MQYQVTFKVDVCPGERDEPQIFLFNQFSNKIFGFDVNFLINILENIYSKKNSKYEIFLIN